MNQATENLPARRLKESSVKRLFSTCGPDWIDLGIGFSLFLVIISYVWFVSFGLWTTWSHTTEYYDQLATAFTHGSLSVEKEVDPALLALANPYNPAEREGINYPLDFSLYNGKYYLYFGPAPALLLAFFKLLGIGLIGDQYLVFLFACGWFIFQSLLIVELRRQFFPDTPKWILPICILFGGLISPLPWMLTEGRFYEAASTSGQFFFLAGLYFNLRSLAKDSTLPGRFLIGSTLWAGSLASRLTQSLPIAFLTFLIALLAVVEYFKTRSNRKTIYAIASLGLPLAIGIALLGWYNWARFGSVLETGYSYQLSTPDLQRYGPKLFLPVYILPNAYEYLVAPPQVDAVFPFLHPIRARGDLRFPFLTLPKVYHTRAMTGILCSTPFIIFAGIALAAVLFPGMGMRDRGALGIDTHLLRWIVAGLAGAFLFGFAPIVTFFWVVTRYFSDFSPALLLLSITGFWLGYCLLVNRPALHRIYAAAGITMMIASIVSSNLLMFSIRAPLFQGENPLLWHQLTSFFSH